MVPENTNVLYFHSLHTCREQLVFAIYGSLAGGGRAGDSEKQEPKLTDASYAPPPGLPHHDARFGDGDQWLPVSDWSNGGTVYIPGTAQESL